MNPSEYRSALNNYITSPEFSALPDVEKQQNIDGFRSNYLFDNPDSDTNLINSITEEQNKSFLRETGRGRVIPTDFLEKNNIIFPNQQPGYKDLTQSQRQEKLDEFKATIPDLAKANPTQREDTEFFLNQSVRELERRSNGEGKGRIRSAGSAFAESMIASAANMVGATEFSESVKDWAHENPEYDDEWFQQLSGGAGSAVTSIGVMVGLAATTRGIGKAAGSATITNAAGQVATGGSLVGNGIMRYNEAYENAINEGLDEDTASRAGLSATPSAFIDVLGDRILASKLLPDNANRIFATGSPAEKKKLLGELITDRSMKGRLMDYSKAAIGEGLAEAVGDYAAAYGPYITEQTGNLPSADEQLRSFAIGAILGGGINAAIDLPDFLGNKTISDERFATRSQRNLEFVNRNLDKIEPAQQKQIFDLLSQGNYGEAMKSSQEALRAPTPDSSAQTNPLLQPENTQTETRPQDSVVFNFDGDPETTFSDAPLTGFSFAEGFEPVVDIQPMPVESDQFTDEYIEAHINETGLPPSPARKALVVAPIPAMGRVTAIGTPVQNRLDVPAIPEQQQRTVVENSSQLNVPAIPEQQVFQEQPPNIIDAPFLPEQPRGAVSGTPTETRLNVPELPVADFSVFNEDASQPQTLASMPVYRKLKASNQQFVAQQPQVIPTLEGAQEIENSTPEQGLPGIQDPVDQASVATTETEAEPQPLVSTPLQVIESPKSSLVRDAEIQAKRAAEKAKQIMGISNDPSFVLMDQVNGSETITPDVLFARINNVDPNASQALERMAEDIAQKNKSVKFRLLDRVWASSLIGGARGAYDPKNNIIYLSDSSIRTVGHEVAHALTVNDVNKWVNGRKESGYKEKLDAAFFDESTPAYIKSLIDVYYHTAKEFGQYDQIGRFETQESKDSIELLSETEYAFINLSEFVAEAMSSQSFQEILADIPYGQRSIWKAIVDAISQGLDWIRSIADPELVLRNDGENALVATLASANQIIESGPRRRMDAPMVFLPSSVDQAYLSDIASGRSNADLQPIIDQAAEDAGYDSTTVYYRGDTVEWSEGIRPIYLTTDQSLARQFADGGEPRRFYIKKNLNLASPGVKINNAILETSSYLGPTGQILTDGLFEPRINITTVSKAGFDGLRGIVDGGTENEIVVLDPRNVKSANAITYDTENFPILPSRRFNDRINNINYLPSQTRSKSNARQFKRLAALRKGSISDKADYRTQEMIGTLGRIQNSDLSVISNDLRNMFFKLVDNIYEARKSAVENPQSRWDSDDVLLKLEAVTDAITKARIAQILDKYDGVINFDKITMDKDDLDSVKTAINDYMLQNDVAFAAAQKSRSENVKKKFQRIHENYKREFRSLQEVVKLQFKDADNFISEIEAQQGAPITSYYLREIFKTHYDYLSNLDPSGLEGKDLYQHFFAINNLSDGNITGLKQTTIKHIAAKRDTNDNLGQFANTFRDPVANANRLAQAVDSINQNAELHQVQLQRLSAYDGTREFLQNNLMGNLYDAVVRESNNRKLQYMDEYASFRTQMMEDLGRQDTDRLSSEDTISMSIMGRLVQFQQGTDPDVQLLKNIKKERQSIQNTINNSPSLDNRKLIRTRVLPLFDQMVKGLESYGKGSMVHLMETMDTRMMGQADIRTGAARRLMLDKAQEIFSRFNTESKFISEGFYGQPFKQQVNYISNDVVSLSTQTNEKEIDLTAPAGEQMNQNYGPGVTKKASHLNERSGQLGERDSYSYNFEGILSRNVEKLAVETSTIAERFIIKERLRPDSPLNNIISKDENGNSHQNRVAALEQMAGNLYMNALSRGVPLNLFTEILRGATSLYARPTLSSIHHIITQPLAACTDYCVRTGNIDGWFKAAVFYAKNMDKVDEWLKTNQRWTGDRSSLEADVLDVRRSPKDDSIKSLQNNSAVRYLNKLYDGASDIMTFFMRRGDNYSTKVTLLAEYERLLKAKGYKFDDLLDVDFNNTEGQILTQATLNTERNINTSNKVLRGSLFTDRKAGTTIIRNLLFAFSAHSASLATQSNQAVRDILNLKAMGAPSSEINSKIRTIAAIGTQQLAFTTGRYIIGGVSTKLMIELISSLFDDEEGKLAELEEKVMIAQKKGNPVDVANAKHELQNAKIVRSVLTKMEQQSMTPGSWFKSVIRDGSGALHLGMNNGGVQKAIFLVPDKWGQDMFRIGNEAVIDDYKIRIREAKDKGKVKEAAKLSEEMFVLDSAEYIPFAYSSFDSLGLGGLYGSAFDSTKRIVEQANGAVMGTQEFNYTDLITSGIALGVGQSEITRTLNAIDRIENRQFKERKEFQEKKLPTAKEKKASKRSLTGPRLFRLPSN